MTTPTTTDGSFGNIRPVKIEEEMRASYLDYAMSVIVARALPDVRDGLKPVQRRILYAMHDMGIRPGSAFKKSARIVGEVLGKYHPHGDDPVYEAMVRMAQDFSLRYPLIDGQGNFGSIDNDPPAAMRYTEARLAAIAEEMLVDIEKDTVDFTPNFDDSLQEPVVLPARLPNLLVNGASGIAVGMATSIPPHNLGEICDAVARLIDEPDTTTEELAKIVRGPDFPTGGIIYRMRTEAVLDEHGARKEVRRDAIREAYSDGRGRVVVKGRAHIEEMARGNREQIVITELPFQVNKAALVEKIASLVKDRRIEGISDLRDESDRHGMRIVIELSRGGHARQVLNLLYKYTALQSSFPINMVALVDSQPQTIGLKKALSHYIDFRRQVIRRRSQHDLTKAQEREHILKGLLIALDDLDGVIQAIRRAQSAEAAKERLMGRPWKMTDRQAQAVLDMQLRRLARLERQKIQDEYAEILQTIAYLEDLLANPRKIDFLIKEDALELKKKYGDARRTQIIEQEAESFSSEDLVAHQETVVALSNRGYIKRMPLETYRPQRRGGRGITGMVTRETDAVRRLIVADTHDNLLFFTDRGRVFQLKAFEVQEYARTARGIPLINLIEIDSGELVTALVAIRDYDKDCMLLATAQGEIKRTPLSEFQAVRKAGLIAMDLEPGDELVFARTAHEDDDVVLVTSDGKAARFAVAELRSASRASGGVRGIRLAKGARVVGMDVVQPGHQLLTVTANGFGKRTDVDEFPRKHRGGGGVITHRVTKKTGPVVAARMVSDSDELMITSRGGIVIRMEVKYARTPAGGSKGIPVVGRASQGVTLMNVAPGDPVASIACIDMRPPSWGATAGSGAAPADQNAPPDEPPPTSGSKGPGPGGAAGKHQPKPRRPKP